jgi:hypothetical protein
MVSNSSLDIVLEETLLPTTKIFIDYAKIMVEMAGF